MNAIGDVEATKNQYLRQAKTEADRTAITLDWRRHGLRMRFGRPWDASRSNKS
jgi:hypothetical protein